VRVPETASAGVVNDEGSTRAVATPNILSQSTQNGECNDDGDDSVR